LIQIKADISYYDTIVTGKSAVGIDESALVWRPGKKALEDRPRPPMREATVAVVRLAKITICGTGLHILRATSRPTRWTAVVLTAMDEVQSV
jgi:hypothetical protein